MNVPNLSKRLAAAAHYVRFGATAADVGCDHGKLAVYLALKKSPFVYACDINPLPLQCAVQTATDYRINQKVHIFLSDGLKNVPHDVDDIIITGMGGKLISDIVLKEPWVFNPNVQLILQPQSFAPILRKLLCQNGFTLLSETPVIEQNHTYCIIHTKYTGKRRLLCPSESVLGKLANSSHPDACVYLHRQWKKYYKIVTGMQKAKVPPNTYNSYLSILQSLSNWKDVKDYDNAF